jgi:hypothetical protein
VGYFSALLSKPDHKLWWMTDRDEIVPNDHKEQDVKRLLAQVLAKYRPAPYKLTAFAKSFKHDGAAANIDHNDLLSIPDLAAGTLANFCTTRLQLPGTERPPKDKVNIITNWLGHQSIGLKKMQFVMSPAPKGMFPGPGGGYAGTLLTIEPTDREDVTLVPITFM